MVYTLKDTMQPEVRTLKALLVRVGADQSSEGGRWNGPVDRTTGDFVYVAIPEAKKLHEGFEKPYRALEAVLGRFRVALPRDLIERHMHLDPDFQHLTYGDQGERARQLAQHLSPGDWIVFYAGLADVRQPRPLVYALIGLLEVEHMVLAAEVSAGDRDLNAHSRRILRPGAGDLIVRGRPGRSGRLARCVPIGEYRDGAYRVTRDLLHAWGDLTVKDGFLQRSARLPRFCEPVKFRRWFEAQSPTLLERNN
jgi:hypothetical protein